MNYATISFFDMFFKLLIFTFTAHASFKNRKALFLKILACALGCFFLASLYDFCYFFCLNIKPLKFTIGRLGEFGGVFFLFSSYYGAMNRIGDDKRKDLVKFKAISFLLALLNVFTCLILKLYIANVSNYSLIFSFCSSAVLYFAFKNLILPDISGGILDSIRAYNFFIVIFCFAQSLHGILMVCWLEAAIFLKIIICLCELFAAKFACEGVKKWFI